MIVFILAVLLALMAGAFLGWFATDLKRQAAKKAGAQKKRTRAAAHKAVIPPQEQWKNLLSYDGWGTQDNEGKGRFD